jgi:hypothetical protein
VKALYRFILMSQLGFARRALRVRTRPKMPAARATWQIGADFLEQRMGRRFIVYPMEI